MKDAVSLRPSLLVSSVVGLFLLYVVLSLSAVPGAAGFTPTPPPPPTDTPVPPTPEPLPTATPKPSTPSEDEPEPMPTPSPTVAPTEVVPLMPATGPFGMGHSLVLGGGLLGCALILGSLLLVRSQES